MLLQTPFLSLQDIPKAHCFSFEAHDPEGCNWPTRGLAEGTSIGYTAEADDGLVSAKLLKEEKANIAKFMEIKV
jgi:hypothetical protein